MSIEHQDTRADAELGMLHRCLDADTTAYVLVAQHGDRSPDLSVVYPGAQNPAITAAILLDALQHLGAVPTN